jgi:hypothetical protein
MSFSFEHLYFNLCDYPYEIIKIMKAEFGLKIFNFNVDFKSGNVSQYLLKNFSKIDLIKSKNTIETLHITFGINLLGTLMHFIEVLQNSISDKPKLITANVKKSEPEAKLLVKQFSLNEVLKISREKQLSLTRDMDRIDKPAIKFEPQNKNSSPVHNQYSTSEIPNPQFENIERIRFRMNISCRLLISDLQVMVLTSTSPYEKNFIRVILSDFTQCNKRKDSSWHGFDCN